MSNFKVGDKVVRSDMDLDHVPSSYVGVFKEKVPLTVKAVEGNQIFFKEIESNWTSKRFKLYEDTSKHHRHHDQIIAWAKGSIIQYYSKVHGKWLEPSCNNPSWHVHDQYRIKPDEIDVRQQKIDHIKSEMRKLADQLNELQIN